MTSTFKKIIATGIFLIVLAGAAVALVMSGGCSASHGNEPIDDFKNGIVNGIIDITGVKGTLDSELRKRTGALASQLGISESAADGIVDSLAIKEWKATTLPAGVQERSTNTIETERITADVTTYDDPSYVTISAYGVGITLEVPESARTYTPLIELIPLFM